MNKLREEGHHACAEFLGEMVYMEDMIMEEILGRKLKDDETVFHKNKNTLDNRRENLKLVKFGIDVAIEGDDRTVGRG